MCGIELMQRHTSIHKAIVGPTHILVSIHVVMLQAKGHKTY